MADVEREEIAPIFNGMVDANPPNDLTRVVFDIQPLTDSISAEALNGDGTVGDNKRQNATALRDILQRFGQAFQSNRANNQRYKNIVQTGLTSIKELINEIGRLLNQLSGEIQRLRQAANAGDENAARIAQLTAQRDALTNVIDQATAVLGTLVGADGSLTGAIDLNPQQLARELSTIINGLTSEREKSRNILAANDAPELADPIIPDRGAAPPAGPGLRRGGSKRKSKRHQKKSKKTTKKRSKKTAKKGKKMRGGYSYGKSKRRRGRSSPSSSAPSSLSSASKNVILF